MTPGTVLGGRYVVGAQLGSGGWGAVYEGTQRDLGRRVAIKVLRTDRVLDHDGLARFAREARAAAALGHPNIVQVTDFQVVPGESPFMVMEHLSGRTFGELLRAEGRLAPARVSAIVHQVLSGLEAAHRAGIVHRDVKPDNVFLVSTSGVEDFVKLLDFGIAKLAAVDTAPLTGHDTLLGTPSFMAPEQVAGGLTEIDGRADLYAVGAMMYLALAGRMPIEAPSLPALLYAIMHKKPAPLAVAAPGIDPRLAMIVDRALHKDRDGRFASAAEMRAALESCAPSGARPAWAGGPTTAPAGTRDELGATEVMRAPGHGAKVVVAIGAAVVALGALGLGAAALLRRDAPTAASPGEGVTSLDAGDDASAAAAVSVAVVDAGAVVSADADAGAEVALVASVDAGATPAPARPVRARMTGRTPRITGGGWGPFGSVRGRELVGVVMPAITACHVATEYEPPEHEWTEWVLTVPPTGGVTNVRRVHSRPADRHPTFEACMTSALSKTPFPASRGGDVRVFFTARR